MQSSSLLYFGFVWPFLSLCPMNPKDQRIFEQSIAVLCALFSYFMPKEGWIFIIRIRLVCASLRFWSRMTFVIECNKLHLINVHLSAMYSSFSALPARSLLGLLCLMSLLSQEGKTTSKKTQRNRPKKREKRHEFSIFWWVCICLVVRSENRSSSTNTPYIQNIFHRHSS